MLKKEIINPFGIINFRSQKKQFGIKLDDRRRHIYVIGKTGSGKTNVMETMAINDIRAGNGIAIVDPHGEFAERMLDFVPENRIKDVVYFDPSDMNYPIAFNPLEQVAPEFRHLVASGIMGVFKKIWVDAWSGRMEYILNNTLLALLESPGSTLLGIMRMLNDAKYRKFVVDNLKDHVVKGFWVNEFGKWTEKFQNEATAAIQNKVGAFVTNPLIRNILGQSHSSLDMRKAMDESKILIFNLSKGKIGEGNSELLGAMIITKLQLAAMSRVDIPEAERRDFYLYVDEFQNFATESFAGILSEARKYRLCLILAHQYIAQLTNSTSTKVRDAVFGNVGTMICGRVGAEDAEFLEKEFQPDFMAPDFVNLPKYNFYIRLLIDGISGRPFSATGIPPEKSPEHNYRGVVIENSRRIFGTPKALVEEKIATEWLSGGADSATDKLARKTEQPLSAVLKPKLDSVFREDYRAGGDFRKPRSEAKTEYKQGERLFRPQVVRPETPVKPVMPSVPLAPKSEIPEASKSISLSQLISKPAGGADSVPFSEARPEKKKVDMNDLRAALEKSLSAIPPQSEDFDDVAEE